MSLNKNKNFPVSPGESDDIVDFAQFLQDEDMIDFIDQHVNDEELLQQVNALEFSNENIFSQVFDYLQRSETEDQDQE